MVYFCCLRNTPTENTLSSKKALDLLSNLLKEIPSPTVLLILHSNLKEPSFPQRRQYHLPFTAQAGVPSYSSFCCSVPFHCYHACSTQKYEDVFLFNCAFTAARYPSSPLAQAGHKDLLNLAVTDLELKPKGFDTNEKKMPTRFSVNK